MSVADLRRRLTRRAICYGLALMLPPVCAALTSHIQQLQRIPFGLYYLSVVVIAAIGGLGPSLLCVAEVAVLNDAMLLAAHKPSAFFHSNPLRYAMLLAGALLVSFVSESRRRSEEKLRGIDEALLPRIFDPFFSTKDETGTASAFG